MSKLIANEIPSGVIDWVNKVFTFSNNIDEIVTLVYDGAEYTNFVVDSVNKKQVTLIDAPKYEVYADYYPTTSDISYDSDITFWGIKNRIWDLLGQTGNSTNFRDEILSSKINNVARRVLKWRITSLLNPNKIYRSWKLWFLDNTINLRIKAWSILSEELALWDDTLKCTTSDLLPSWYVYIGKDVISYTGIDSEGLVGVSGQTVSHLVGEKVIQLYEMPVNMDKPNKMNKIIGDREAEIPLYTWQERTYYDIVRTWSVVLLDIVWLCNNDLVQVDYISRYIDMTDNSDINPLPETYWIDVLAYLSAGELAYEKKLANSGELLNMAYANLQNMYQDYTNQTNVITQSIKPRSYKFNSVRFRR